MWVRKADGRCIFDAFTSFWKYEWRGDCNRDGNRDDRSRKCFYFCRDYRNGWSGAINTFAFSRHYENICVAPITYFAYVCINNTLQPATDSAK